MIFRALFAFLMLPGLAAVLAPPVIARLDPWSGEPWAPGVIVMGLGAVLLLWCVRDFFVSGKGTLAPWDPPKNLVVVGLYKFTRNPMYVGVLTLVLGWALFLTSWLVLAYTLALFVGFHIRVVTNEEPWLTSQFGEQWERYKQAVPRWRFRLSPWQGGLSHRDKK